MTSSSAPLDSMREERLAPRPEAVVQTQARSRLCRIPGRAFALPGGAPYDELAGGAGEREVAEKPEALPLLLSLADLSLTPVDHPVERPRVEYVRPFEVSFIGGPPCSLFAGHDERHHLTLVT